jgi:hypothetical protein
MNQILKYSFPIQEKVTVELPKNCKIIRVDFIDGFAYVWVIGSLQNPKEERCFEMYKTGQEIATPLEDLVFLGTFKIVVGQELCLYVFENVGVKFIKGMKKCMEHTSKLLGINKK